MRSPQASSLELMHIIRPLRARYVQMTLLAVATQAMAILQPWPMQILIDHVLGDHPLPAWLTWLPRSGHRGVLIGCLAAVSFLLPALALLLESRFTLRSTELGAQAAFLMARDLFAQLQRRSLRFHTAHTVGDSLTRVVGDSWCISKVAAALFLTVTPAVVTIGVMIAVMARLNAALTGVAVLAAPFMAGAALIWGQKLRRLSHARRDVETRLQSHLQQTLSGIQVVQAFGQEERQRSAFTQLADESIQAQEQTVLLSRISQMSMGFAATVGTGAVLLVGAGRVLNGTLTVGGLLVFLAYLKTLQGRFSNLGRAYNTLQSVHGQVERVLEILTAEPDVQDRPGAQAVGRVAGHVRLESVTFGYDEGQPVLHNIDLDVTPGETVAIVGPSGAGKSTLVSLIPRFFDPWHGRLLIDGIDTRDLRLRNLRDNVAIVLQEPFLFPTSIAANIAYGRPGASPARIEAAARAANAHDFIMQLPRGYDTVIGERGATLSGGERQRISIARALLKDAPILILDEPTSALDARNESHLVDALHRLMHGRTTFIIAHRLSTIRNAGRIVVLEAGRIVARGTHEELIREGGLYAGMVRTADGEFRTAPTRTESAHPEFAIRDPQ